MNNINQKWYFLLVFSSFHVIFSATERLFTFGAVNDVKSNISFQFTEIAYIESYNSFRDITLSPLAVHTSNHKNNASNRVLPERELHIAAEIKQWLQSSVITELCLVRVKVCSQHINRTELQFQRQIFQQKCSMHMKILSQSQTVLVSLQPIKSRR